MVFSRLPPISIYNLLSITLCIVIFSWVYSMQIFKLVKTSPAHASEKRKMFVIVTLRGYYVYSLYNTKRLLYSMYQYYYGKASITKYIWINIARWSTLMMMIVWVVLSCYLIYLISLCLVDLHIPLFTLLQLLLVLQPIISYK